MADCKAMTLEEVRAQIAAREKEIVTGEQDPPSSLLETALVTAHEEALERLCDALGYMERSLSEVVDAKAKLQQERAGLLKETLQAKSDAARLGREVEAEAQGRAAAETALEQQRAKQQRAWAEAQSLRAELASLRGAQREVARQMAATDEPSATDPASSIPG